MDGHSLERWRHHSSQFIPSHPIPWFIAYTSLSWDSSEATPVGKFFILHISTILDVRKTKKMDMVMEIIGFFYMHSMNSDRRIDVGEMKLGPMSPPNQTTYNCYEHTQAYIWSMNSFLRPPVQPLESVGDTIIQTNNKCHPINASCKTDYDLREIVSEMNKDDPYRAKMGFNRVFRWKCFRTQLPRVKFKTCRPTAKRSGR